MHVKYLSSRLLRRGASNLGFKSQHDSIVAIGSRRFQLNFLMKFVNSYEEAHRHSNDPHIKHILVEEKTTTLPSQQEYPKVNRL